MMAVPLGARFVLDRLCAAGHTAYLVGGCVRDALMGVTPKDYDICTSALPNEMQRIFADCHVIETGLQHGTLTVMYDHEPYEVTTYRIDGEYTDHRRPDSVSFVTDVTADLARRDFTVNAMAYHPVAGLVDPFGGQEDIRRGVIRCVGEAELRFGEDALRIMRALRFAATKQFAIEESTAAAVHKLKHTLSEVAVERIRVELAKMLCGDGCMQILRDYHDVLCVFLPELLPMKDFDQRNPHHRYDLWEHTVRAVGAAPKTETLRLTMLLHDAGKHDCFSVDENGIGHMYGHPRRSSEIARDVATRLKMDTATAERVALLVEHHDVELTCEARLLKRRLNKLGEDALRQLIDVQYADRVGTGMCDEQEMRNQRDMLLSALDTLLASAPCFTLKSLAVTGRDLIPLGITGPALGVTLKRLLEAVIDEQVENERGALIALAKEISEV